MESLSKSGQKDATKPNYKRNETFEPLSVWNFNSLPEKMEGLSIWSMLPKSDPQRMDAQADEPQESVVPEAAPSHRASVEISQPRRRRVKPEMEKKHLQYLLKQEFKLSKPEERIEIMTHKIELVDNKRPELPGVKSESDSDDEYYDAGNCLE